MSADINQYGSTDFKDGYWYVGYIYSLKSVKNVALTKLSSAVLCSKFMVKRQGSFVPEWLTQYTDDNHYLFENK